MPGAFYRECQIIRELFYSELWRNIGMFVIFSSFFFSSAVVFICSVLLLRTNNISSFGYFISSVFINNFFYLLCCLLVSFLESSSCYRWVTSQSAWQIPILHQVREKSFELKSISNDKKYNRLRKYVVIFYCLTFPCFLALISDLLTLLWCAVLSRWMMKFLLRVLHR